MTNTHTINQLSTLACLLTDMHQMSVIAKQGLLKNALIIGVYAQINMASITSVIIFQPPTKFIY